MKRKHIRKRIFAVLICLIVSMVCFILPAMAEEAEPLTVGVPNDRCPLFYKDPDTGEPIGIGVDLMRVVAEKAGYKAVFQFIKEANLKEALDNPEYDIIMPFGSVITSASGKSIIITENLMQTPFTFVTRGNRELPDISSLRVGMLKSLSGGN